MSSPRDPCGASSDKRHIGFPFWKPLNKYKYITSCSMKGVRCFLHHLSYLLSFSHSFANLIVGVSTSGSPPGVFFVGLVATCQWAWAPDGAASLKPVRLFGVVVSDHTRVGWVSSFGFVRSDCRLTIALLWLE